MKEELTNALQIITIVIVCILSLIFFNQNLLYQEQIKYFNNEIQEMNKELDELRNELGYNDEIVSKVLNKEW